MSGSYGPTKELLTDVAGAIKERDTLIAAQGQEIRRLRNCIDQIEKLVMDYLTERQAADREALTARISATLDALPESDS